MKINLKIIILIFFYVCVILNMVDAASAHRVNVFAWVDGDTIHVESKFSGGKKVNAGKVIVMDPQGVELLSGLTNDQGEYSFKVPKQSDLRIILNAGQGHRGEWTVRASELQGIAAETRTGAHAENTVADELKKAVPGKSVDLETAGSGAGIKPQELEAVVESVLDRKLRPITTMLADLQQEGPGVRDIFAGIGYILGLVGIATYVHNRKKKD
jgi:nickel transport protein